MRPTHSKRIQVYLKFPSGFLVIGTDPRRSWIFTGGRLISRSEPRTRRLQCSHSS